MENYNLEEIRPSTLQPCGHSVCTNCVEFLRLCPLCKAEITSSEINFTLEALMEHLTISQVEEKKEEPTVTVTIIRIPLVITEEEMFDFFHLLSFSENIVDFSLEKDE